MQRTASHCLLHAAHTPCNCAQGISPYQNAVLVDSSSRVLTLSENLRALLANGAGVDDDGLVGHAAALHMTGKLAFNSYHS